jgi:plasmid stability protein
MNLLHVRNVPDRLYTRLQAIAAKESRSLSAEVISLLDRAVRDATSRRKVGRVLADIRRRRYHPPPGAPRSLSLLREDRAR